MWGAWLWCLGVASAAPAAPSAGRTDEPVVVPAPVADLETVSAVAAATDVDVPTALIIRGGASLGSYQAGYLHYTSQLLAARRALARREGAAFDIVTGASAGALNTLVTAVSACLKPPPRPEESLYWLWTKVRVDPTGRDPDRWNLFKREEVGATYAFTRQPFMEAAFAVGAALQDPNQWIDEACEVDMGFVVSRVDARDTRLSRGLGTGLKAARQSEKFVVRLSKPAGGAPTLTPVVPLGPDGERSSVAHLYLHLGLGGEGEPIAFDDLVAVLAASSGFPFAFSPVKIPHQEYQLDGTVHRPERAEHATFVDGGLFENLPLRLATHIAGWRASAGAAPLKPRNYLVLDTDVEAWRRAPLTVDLAPGSDIVSFGLELFGSYVSAAEDAELLSAIEDDPDLALSPIEDFGTRHERRSRLFVPSRRAIPASAWFVNFLGLFEEDFRSFDYYLGMLEARHNVSMAFPEELENFEALGLPSVNAPLFDCFLAWDQASAGFSRLVPRSEEPEACAAFEGLGPGGNHLPLLRASTALRQWTESAEYNTDERVAFDYWAEQLHRSGFHWRTLRDHSEGAHIRGQVRDFIEIAVRRMSHENGVRGMVLDAGVRVLVDGYAYRPALITPFVGLHSSLGVEGGVGVRLADAARATFGARLGAIGNRYVDTGGVQRFGMQVEPLFRLEFTPPLSPVFRVEPWVGYAAAFPFTFEGELVGQRHVVGAGVHLVGLNVLYFSIGGGFAAYEQAGSGFDLSALRPYTGRGQVELAFGVRIPR
jgi:predicted acylesterase/phospholipase RssA